YDTLIEQLGGKPAPAVGWGLGIERVLLLLAQAGVAPVVTAPDVYAIVPTTRTLPRVMCTLETLRLAGVRVLMQASGPEGPSSIKSQFKRADASGARHALIFGIDELARAEVSIKPLRDATAVQRSVPLADVANWAAGLRNA